MDEKGNPNIVSASTLNNPQGVFRDGNKVYVADTGNNRILIWNTFPQSSGVPADVVVGQSAFDTKLSGTSPTAMKGPRKALVAGGNLFVADTGNARVLVFSPVPTANVTPAATVLGQMNLTTAIVPFTASATNMYSPWNLTVSNDKLWVVDLVFERITRFNLALQ